MSTTLLRIVIGLFLIAHGLVHFILTLVPLPAPGAARTPFWPSWWRDAVEPLWLAARLELPQQVVRAMGSILWAAALVGFVLAGLGVLGVPGLNSIWQVAVVFAAVVSLVLLVLYWHPQFGFGVAINLGVLVAIWQHYPAFLFG